MQDKINIERKSSPIFRNIQVDTQKERSELKCKQMIILTFTLYLFTAICFINLNAWATPLCSTSTSIEESVTNLATKLLGTPYKPGGNTSSGFDTSGFTQFVFKACTNKLLPRTVAGQYQQGAPIKQSDLIIADLVFFKIDGHLKSTGIYIGDTQFITVTTKGVKVQSLSTKYWKKNYAGSKRIIQPSIETKKLIKNILDLAKQGKTVNCEFPIGTTKEMITNTWGKPDDDPSKAEDEEDAFWRSVHMSYNTKKCSFTGFRKVVDKISCSEKQKFSLTDVQKTLGNSVPLHAADEGVKVLGYQAGQFLLCFYSDDYSISNSDYIHDIN